MRICIFVSCVAIMSCANKIYRQRIASYLNASTVEQKGKYMADDYRSYFEEKIGHGKDKQAALKSFSNWDGPMHPDIQILNYSSKGNTWTVHFNEKNEFAKLIGFPGWKGTSEFTFNSKKLITESIYIPDSTNPSYKPYLLPALDWLQQNMPAQLDEVYKENKLVQNEQSAKKWILLLRTWSSTPLRSTVS
jgi:hypothetical protein